MLVPEKKSLYSEVYYVQSEHHRRLSSEKSWVGTDSKSALLCWLVSLFNWLLISYSLAGIRRAYHRHLHRRCYAIATDHVVCVCMQSYELFITGLFTDYLSLHVVVLLINNTLKSRWTLCFFHQLFFSLTLLNVLKLRWFTRLDLLFNVMQAFFRHFFEGNH